MPTLADEVGPISARAGAGPVRRSARNAVLAAAGQAAARTAARPLPEKVNLPGTHGCPAAAIACVILPIYPDLPKSWLRYPPQWMVCAFAPARCRNNVPQREFYSKLTAYAV